MLLTTLLVNFKLYQPSGILLKCNLKFERVTSYYNLTHKVKISQMVAKIYTIYDIYFICLDDNLIIFKSVLNANTNHF